MTSKKIMTGTAPTRRELDSWWIAFEDAAAAPNFDLSQWLDAHPYPTTDAEHAADMRRRIVNFAGQAT